MLVANQPGAGAQGQGSPVPSLTTSTTPYRLFIAAMSDRKVSGALQERIAKLNAAQSASSTNEPKALAPGGLSKLRSRFEGQGDAPLIPKGSFGLGAPSTAPSRGSADRNRIASASNVRATSPNPSPKPSRILDPASKDSSRSSSPVPSAGVPETSASLDSTTTASSSHVRAPSEASSIASSPASSVARSGLPGGIPNRLTHELLPDPPGMRTPMSVNSMHVETGSEVGSHRNPLDDFDGDTTPPQLLTPSASVQGDVHHLSGDIAELSLDVHPGSEPGSPKAMPSGMATPTSTVGSALDDRAREEATERQLEAYENEQHDPARSPETSPVDEGGEQGEGRIRHVPLTAHEAAKEAHASPVPDTDEEPAREEPSLEEVGEGSLISEVPGNAMAAAQPPSKPEGIKSPPPDVAPPAQSKLAMTNQEPEVESVVPIEADPVADAGDVEALQGGVKPDADAVAIMTGPPTIDEGVTGDFLDSFDEEEQEPKVKCSDCQIEVPLTELGEHTCAVPPPSKDAFATESLDTYVTQPQASSASVPEDISLEDDLEILASPAPEQQPTPSQPIASPPVSSALPDFPPSQTVTANDHEESPSHSPLDSDFPKPPTSNRTSPTTQRVMSDYSGQGRRSSSDSANSLRQRRAGGAAVPRGFDGEDSDGEYEGGWVRPISSTR